MDHHYCGQLLKARGPRRGPPKPGNLSWGQAHTLPLPAPESLEMKPLWASLAPLPTFQGAPPQSLWASSEPHPTRHCVPTAPEHSFLP